MANNKISIITSTLNSEKYLEQAILSIVNQTYPNKEYIIIDGGSTDGTLNIIKKYAEYIDHCISEPDNGIADAMNKGLKLFQGDFILFLHSDDYLLDQNVLTGTSEYLDENHDIFLFNLFYLDNGYKELTTPRGFTWWMNFKTGVLHQGCICSRHLFEKIGTFDTDFKITMDYDFFLRAYRAGAKVKYINIPLSVMRKTGISSQTDWANLKKRFSEERFVHKKNCPNLFMSILYTIYWSLYIPYRKVLSLLSA